ncbi:MAG: hypothetical protein R8K49_04545 [Mariprofundaceae bacterium]
MKRLSMLVVLVCMSAGTAFSADWLESVDDRYDVLHNQLKGNHSYEAHLARELASIASEEKSQHDTDVAKAFMTMAEQHAHKAGVAK